VSRRSPVHRYCVLEQRKFQNLGALEFLLAVDRGKECGPSIPELFGSSPVWHLGEFGCVVGKYSEA
jgi:hypothetical protein